MFTACIGPGGPGYIYKNISSFDNAVEWEMEPALIYGSSAIKMALFKSSRMQKNDLVLKVIIGGVHTFTEGESLHFKIDGEVVNFSSVDKFTDIEADPGLYGGGFYIPPSTWSEKRYLIDIAFLKRIITAKEVLIKVDLGKTYAEGIFSVDYFTTARPAFKKFYKNITGEDI